MKYDNLTYSRCKY